MSIFPSLILDYSFTEVSTALSSRYYEKTAGKKGSLYFALPCSGLHSRRLEITVVITLWLGIPKLVLSSF